jgi:hypothetical protein
MHALAAAGGSLEELQTSVFVEKLLQRGYEVLYLTEPVDEYMMTHLTEFDDRKFQDASKDDVKLGKDDKKAFKALKARRRRCCCCCCCCRCCCCCCCCCCMRACMHACNAVLTACTDAKHASRHA